MSDHYLIHSSGYLFRARRALDSRFPESLLHAAFELRCGIEARMREYLEEQAQVSRRLREGWRIATLATGLEEAFGAAVKEARFTIRDDSGILLMALSYRPVTRRLRSAAERLGDYLHVQRVDRSSEDPWWDETRAFLATTCRQLEWAVSGKLLGSPLIDPNGLLYMNAEISPETRALFSRGMRTEMNVEYLEPPEFF